jgi:hypothetical protein
MRLRDEDGKEEIAQEAFRYSLARVSEARWEGLDSVKGSVEKLRFMIRGFVNESSVGWREGRSTRSSYGYLAAKPARR